MSINIVRFDLFKLVFVCLSLNLQTFHTLPLSSLDYNSSANVGFVINIYENKRIGTMGSNPFAAA